MQIPTLTTTDLLLRGFTEEDIAPMHQIMGGEDVLRYFPGSTAPDQEKVGRMIAGMLKHWEERGYGLWAIESRSTGELMGRCGLQYLPEVDGVEVDFILGRPFWGQGYATQAGRASVRYGFEQLGLEQITGIVHVENAASRRVLEKLGLECQERAEFFGIDCYRYAIDRTAFEAASPTW